MKIIDLNEKYVRNYFAWLEDWSDEIKEAENHKEQWYRKWEDKGLSVKLAINEKEKPVGMIQYIPVEYSFVEGLAEGLEEPVIDPIGVTFSITPSLFKYIDLENYLLPIVSLKVDLVKKNP